MPEQPTPQRLEYATPAPPRSGSWGLEDVWTIGRRVLFTIGCGMLVYGLCNSLSGGRDGEYYAAWGAVFISLMIPLPK